MEDEGNPLLQAELFLKRRGVEGKVLFCMVTGSQAYNLSHDKSDYDFLGVYLAKTEDLLGLTPPASGLSHLPKEDPPDITLHEAGKFAQLLLKGNPFVMEMLFAKKRDGAIYSTPEWDELISAELKQTTLTQRAVEEYLGFIKNQIKQAQQAQQTNNAKRYMGKRIYHMLRLLFETERIIQGVGPWVWMEEGEQQDELWAIKRGETPPEAVIERVEKRIEELEREKEWEKTLPKEMDPRQIDAWLVRIRKAYFDPPVGPKPN